MAFETEVKLYLPDLAPLEARLEEIGATLTKPRLFERNIRYENAEEVFTKQGFVLRLRQDDRVRLTYKESLSEQPSEITRTRLELETVVGDFDTMHAILGKLGYHPYAAYEKYRTTYTYADCEIVLDELPYGNYVEIEGEAAAIEPVIEKLGLANHTPILASYMDIFALLQIEMGLTFHDLTFANFAGLEISPDLLRKPLVMR